MILTKGRLLTTHIMRDGTRFTKEALEECVKQINEKERIMPCNLNHDNNRVVGFIVPSSAKLIRLEGDEYAVDAEVNIYETKEERLRTYVDVQQKESEEYLDFLDITVIKKEDVNCPTYWLKQDIFSILKITPPLNNDKLLMVKEPRCIFQKGILINGDILVVFNTFLRRYFSEPNAYDKRLIDKIREIKIRCPSVEVSFSVMKKAISLKSEFKEEIELDYAWGPKLPINLSLLEKGVTKHITKKEDRVLDNITATEFWWHGNKEGLMTLEIEELRDKSRCLMKGSSIHFPLRYSHLQYDKNKGSVVHFDCALRIYPERTYDDRLTKNDISKAGKNSSRIKLFRIDGEIDAKDAFDIISLFFINNSDVREYFDAEC